MNSSKENSSLTHWQSSSILWYKYSAGPFDKAGHRKHVLMPFQLPVVLQTSRCHSQSPRSSTTANLRCDVVSGTPASSRGFPVKGRFDTPTVGLIPSKAELKDQTSLRHTAFNVRFFTMRALGQVKSKNLLCLTEAGRNRMTFMKMATTFSTLYCVHNRALSPCSPMGMCEFEAGCKTAQSSFKALQWSQNSRTAESGTSIPTWSNKYESTLWGWTIGNDFILNACGGFGDCTGTLIDSISSTVQKSRLKVLMGLYNLVSYLWQSRSHDKNDPYNHSFWNQQWCSLTAQVYVMCDIVHTVY